MKHIVLLGDSIFDNAGYVERGDSVIEQLNSILPNDTKATLLAVDGDVTNDVHAQLDKLPVDTTHVFISCGGNDALRIAGVLNDASSSVGEAMEVFTEIKYNFQMRYSRMLREASKNVRRLSVCTVHDQVPNIEPRALTALSLFNEVITREAFQLGAPLIDLRIACGDVEDYSPISPIEPSKFGAKKIAGLISQVLSEHQFEKQRSTVYR